MRCQDLYVAGTGVWLPPAMSIVEADRRGLCDLATLRRADLLSVTVADHESAPEMAARAARRALTAARHKPADIGLILHANVYYQGHDLWPAASFVQRETVRNTCPALEVRQMSNGGMAALDLAAAYLTARVDSTAALLTAADRFCPPGFDRWRSDPGTVYADGGAALVLSRRGGLARLCSVVTTADPELERMHRGADPFGAAPFSVRQPVDLRACKQAFVADVGLAYCVARTATGQAAALDQALADADVKLAEIDWFVLPHFGRRRLHATYLRRLDIDLAATSWPWGRTVGHLGAGDQFAGLHHLVSTGAARPGQRCLLLGVGAGYSWSCAVLEMSAPD